ncbi:PHB depolymerase family esterase [Kitasatospora purpeofusca]|uniref:PHB depolymerase family esterase n=1 Tax=Kitasatospora purpeofusca TaxID=67352 RepID=UPI002A5AA074|nr:PHB depolymerase family esterase [Kitasatospora purpeofusca]MDY0816642.1 PHB depolymerase family esterase [Kitasatospora purpeofusca]
MSLAVRHSQRLERRRTPFLACRADPRFSYCLYVPPRAPAAPRPLLVVVHGDRRTAERYRDALTDFADTHGCVVLAPLFPVGIPEPEDVLSYKRLRRGDVRFDLVLLRMVEEAAARWPVRADRFLLHGYSGGGQFALRFSYLHPARLLGVSVGAPGSITRLDPALPWPAGIADVAAKFGGTHPLSTPQPLSTPHTLSMPLPPSATVPVLVPVPVHVTVGALDTRPSRRPPHATRLGQALALHQHLLERGTPASLEVVPGIAHNGFALLPAATRFLSTLLPDG